jgi:hypothetical protein
MSDDNLPSGYICTNCKTTYSFLSSFSGDVPEDDYCPVCGEYWLPINCGWHCREDKTMCIGMYSDVGDDGPNWEVEIEVCGGYFPTEPPLENKGPKVEIIEKEE